MPRKDQLKSHCYMGHALTKDNLRVRYIYVNGVKYKSRACKKCTAAREKKNYHKRKLAETKLPTEVTHDS